jgi:thioester reductase-like protein
VVESLCERQLSETLSQGRVKKLVCLPENLQQESLGLSPEDFDVLLRIITVVYHAAWPVNFSMELSSFEPHIKGIQLALET